MKYVQINNDNNILQISDNYQNMVLKKVLRFNTTQHLKVSSDPGSYDLIPEGYRNKMFVNPVFMPHHIMITNIYPAYVQNITDEEALAAGIIKWDKYGDEKNYTYIAPNVGYWRGFGWNDYKTPQEAYGALINKIYGQNVWENNEMWWTIEFETID